jgi:hypothetical protein
VGFEALGDPDIVERRFFASATAPDTAGLAIGAALLAEVLELKGAFVDVLDVLDVEAFSAGLGLDALTEAVGFRAVLAEEVAVVPRFSARLSDFTGV